MSCVRLGLAVTGSAKRRSASVSAVRLHELRIVDRSPIELYRRGGEQAQGAGAGRVAGMMAATPTTRRSGSTVCRSRSTPAIWTIAPTEWLF